MDYITGYFMDYAMEYIKRTIRMSHRNGTIWFFQHHHGKSPFLIGKPPINGPFSMAMLNNQRVYIYIHIIFPAMSPNDTSHLIAFGKPPPSKGVPVSLRLEEEGLQALKSLLPAGGP